MWLMSFGFIGILRMWFVVLMMLFFEMCLYLLRIIVLIELCLRFSVRLNVLFGNLSILFCIMFDRLWICMILLVMEIMVFWL